MFDNGVKGFISNAAETMLVGIGIGIGVAIGFATIMLIVT